MLRTGRFKTGHSGNIKGRPKGNRTAPQIRNLLEVGLTNGCKKSRNERFPSLRPFNVPTTLAGLTADSTLLANGELTFTELAKGTCRRLRRLHCSARRPTRARSRARRISRIWERCRHQVSCQPVSIDLRGPQGCGMKSCSGMVYQLLANNLFCHQDQNKW